MGLRPGETRTADAPLLRRTRWRLAVWSGGATLATLVALGFLLYVAIDRSLVADSEQRLAARSTMVRTAVETRGPNALQFLLSEDGPVGRPQAGGPTAGTTTIVIQPSGRAFGLVPRELINDLPVMSGFQAAKDGAVDVRTVSLAGTPFRVRSEPIKVGDETWTLQVLDNRAAEQRTLLTALRILIIGGLVVLVAAFAFGFMYAGRALIPIRDSLRRQREFAADASHELRTPIAVIRSSADYLGRQPSAVADPEVAGAVDDIRAEGERMTRLVDELLLLARADSDAVEVRAQRLDLTDVAGDALHGLGRLAEERGVQLALEGEPIIVNGDPDRLRQLVAILVDNAVRHSPRGGTVRLAVARDGRGAQVSVADEGSGIRADDLPRVFDRFYRAAGAPTGGSGLGLAIAQWIAERHHGRLAAANGPSGGAVFTLSLPAA